MIPVDVIEVTERSFSVLVSRDAKVPFYSETAPGPYFYAVFENETWIRKGVYTKNGIGVLDGKVELFESDPWPMLKEARLKIANTELISRRSTRNLSTEVLSTDPKVVQIITFAALDWSEYGNSLEKSNHMTLIALKDDGSIWHKRIAAPKGLGWEEITAPKSETNDTL